MAQEQVALDRAAAQVEVAVLHAQVVAAVSVVLDGERRGVGRVEDVQLADLNFDLAGGDLQVLGLAFADGADGLDDKLAAELAGLATGGRRWCPC